VRLDQNEPVEPIFPAKFRTTSLAVLRYSRVDIRRDSDIEHAEFTVRHDVGEAAAAHRA
jgi:hypothetical protein